MSVLQMVKTLESQLGVAARFEWLPRQTGDVTRTWADITKARGALGYAPATPFEEGIGRFVAWLRSVR